MAGTNTTPGAVHATHPFELQHSVVVGPLAHLMTVGTDYPFAKDGIKAIWRNEVGPAS